MSASASERQPWLRSCAMASATRSSSVVTAPPSPVVTILRGWKLRQPIEAERAARAAARGGRRARRRRPRSAAGRAAPRSAPGGRRGARRRIAFVRGPTSILRRIDVHRHRVDVDEHRPQARRARRRSRSPGTCRRGRAPRRRARGRARAPRGGARRCPRRRRSRASSRRPARAPPRTRRRRGPIVSIPLSSTAATAASSSSPTSGQREADRVYLARYHSIVRVEAVVELDLGSQPSSSRAFSTFGMRSSTST